MKFEMTKCNQCGSEMPMGVDICPSCGKLQVGISRLGTYQPRTMLAVGLTAAVLLIFNWFKTPAPHPGSQLTSPPSASLPSR
ncbi:hypothetical protein [Bradyrhizobium septentrionale]|uniref:Uncharacterized protein n=1 Tax=Bradyrhizobium septentrionale TaxID=1404411 RepID=A0A973W2U7_9BRAD|nr:hypothetical protein [Bradyrhizobium septentrionale]UGY14914.1 hypothetical protein HAP48_0041335 [Bradyrhizobium septentrionale]UGY23488.1 hypothetical protein HU675_0036925 [Bradyrhizobium septentrionale]